MSREIASYIQNHLHIDTIAHMTCVGFKQSDLQKNCELLKKEGIHYVMALRGDRPQTMGDEQFNSREFLYASDMIRYLKANTSLMIAGACYPEKHYEAASFESDLMHLKEKVEAGASFLVTQLFFNNEILIAKYGENKEDMRKAGIDYAVRQILDLKEHGVDGIHIYTMNWPKTTAEIVAQICNNADVSC